MNENPEGTPNPLNNNSESTSVDEILDANPAEPIQEETVQVEPAQDEPVQDEPMHEEMIHEEPALNEIPTMQEETIVAQSEAIVTETPPVQDETIAAESVTVDSLDPTGRMMEQTAPQVVEPQAEHKKKGLIFMIIGCILLIVGIAAAVAAAMLMMNKPDPVNAAMQKIMSGNAPKNVAIDGDINILVNDPTALIKRVNVDFDSKTVVGSMINTSSAVLTLTDRSNNDYSAKFEELYAANGDLYFKMEDVADLIENSHVLDLFTSNVDESETETNCITDENGVTNCASVEVTDCTSAETTDCVATLQESVTSEGSTASTETVTLMDGITQTMMSIVEAADGIWLRLSTDDLNLTDSTGLAANSNISCVTDLVNDVNKNSNSAFDMYSKYPFINSSDKNILIASKQNPVYQISLDTKNFTNYINAINNTELARSLYSCMGWSNNAAVTESDVAEIVNAMPKIYAEINSENDFTRLYMESDINDGAAHATIDLGFSYPKNVNVSEPVEYTDYADLIQELFTSMFNMEGTEGTSQNN